MALSALGVRLLFAMFLSLAERLSYEALKIALRSMFSLFLSLVEGSVMKAL